MDDAHTVCLTLVQDSRDMRAIFLLMRWTGTRLIDALMLRRSQVENGWVRLKTKKTGARVERRLPEETLQALAEIGPAPERVRPSHYFWSVACKDADNLSTIWAGRIAALNRYFSLENEDGEPMAFHSHMLRDIFAVELLLRGVPIEDVSRLLTHESIKMTEQYYSPWVKRREARLQDVVQAAQTAMGATYFTPMESRSDGKQLSSPRLN